MSPEALAMDPADLSGEDAKPDMVVHKDRIGADPTEGWRRGTRGELRKSCDTCTASKTKCCGGIPCDRCKKRNLSCKFSKRRRCGPKARPVEEKRARTGLSKDNGIGEAHGFNNTSLASNSGSMSPPRYTPAPVPPGFGLQNGQQPLQLPGSSLPLLPSPSHRPAPVFEAPLTADGLSGLVGIIAPTPTLSDGGGSGSSGASEELSGSFRPLSPRHTIQKHLSPKDPAPHHQHHQPSGQHQQLGISGIPSVMVDSSNPSPNRVAAMAPTTSTTIAPMEQHPGASDLNNIPVPSTAPVSHQQAEPRPSLSQWPFVGGHEGSGEASQAPSRPTLKPSVDLVRPSHGLEDAPVSVPIMDVTQDGNMAGAAPAPAPARRASKLKVRGALPMDPLPAAARLHLATFLKTIGSLLPLPGMESLREALAGWEAGCQDEDMTDVASPADASVRAFGGLGSARLEKIEDSMEEDAGVDAGAAIEDPPRDRTLIRNDEVKIPCVQANIDPTASSLESAPTANPLPHVGKTGDLRMRDGGDAMLSLELGSDFDDACRAEAWAAIAVGALFGGLPREDASPYAMRSLQALPRCLDAPLPEVASAFLLHALFWLHSMEKQKVTRYFGFAQQVGIELGVLMPDGLRHSLAFMSVLVNMALGPEKALSLGVAVRDPVSWSVCTADRPGVDPRIGALGSVALACSKILEESKGQWTDPVETCALFAWDRMPGTVQSLVEMLERAQEGLRSRGRRDADGNMSSLSDDVPMEHLVALVSGLKAYAYAKRGEPAKAEAAARFALGVTERDPGILHLPLTFSLADASKRIVESVGGGACGLLGLSRVPEGVDAACKGNPASKVENGVDGMRANVGMDTSPTRDGLLREGNMTSGAISRPDPIGAGSWCPFPSGGVAGAPTVGSSPKGLERKTEDSSGDGDMNSTMSVSNNVGIDTGNKTSKSPSRASSMTPPPELGRSKKLSRAELMSRRWKPSSVGHMQSAPILLSPDAERSGKSNHPTTVFRARSLDDHYSMGSRWPLVSGSVSPRIVSGVDAPTDWVQRIRSLAPRSPSPGIVGSMGGGRSTPPCDPIEADTVALGAGGDVSEAERPGSSAANGNSLGPMPVQHPPQSPRYASESSGLDLLSGVAAPSPAFQPAPPCLPSVEGSGQAGEKRDAKRVSGGDGTVGVGSAKLNHHAAGAANGARGGVANRPPAAAAPAAAAGNDDDADLDEPPLPSHGLAMSSQVSFDPNREDSTLHDYIFPSISQS